jgi:hypothetical protein
MTPAAAQQIIDDHLAKVADRQPIHLAEVVGYLAALDTLNAQHPHHSHPHLINDRPHSHTRYRGHPMTDTPPVQTRTNRIVYFARRFTGTQAEPRFYEVLDEDDDMMKIVPLGLDDRRPPFWQTTHSLTVLPGAHLTPDGHLLIPTNLVDED